MSADVLSNDMKRLNLKTKTVGKERIRRAIENDEDCAILSTFLPKGMGGDRENKKFICALKDRCLLGDPRNTEPGKFFFFMSLVTISSLVSTFWANKYLSLNCRC